MENLKKFLIIVNRTKDPDLVTAKEVESTIRETGCLVTGILQGDDLYEEGRVPDDLLLRSDAAIVLGGDGTIIHASHVMRHHPIPMIGVNLGTVGFLSDVPRNEIRGMVRRLTWGDYYLEDRMLLEGIVHREGKEEKYIALNDAVFARKSLLRLIAVEIYLNGRLFDTTEADGIIISSPTGSTGYNLSAGGPIVSPSAEVLILTPISPYSLSRRSVVFGSEDAITLKLVAKRENSENKAVVSFDGYDNIDLDVDDYVEVRASRKHASLIRMTEKSMYEILRQKIGG